MAATITNELVYEILKQIQAHIALLKDDMNSVKTWLTSIDTRLGLVHTDMAHQADRLDRLNPVWAVSKPASTSHTKSNITGRAPGPLHVSVIPINPDPRH